MIIEWLLDSVKFHFPVIEICYLVSSRNCTAYLTTCPVDEAEDKEQNTEPAHPAPTVSKQSVVAEDGN